MRQDLVGRPEEKEFPRSYPYLGICRKRGIVVGFEEPRTGSIVHVVPGKVGRLFRHSRLWDESHFEPLRGVIELEN